MTKRLTDGWRACGLEAGDTALVHSSVKRTLVEHGVTPADVLQSLLDAVGPQGTILFPLFNFEFTKGVPFDHRTTPSHMGALTEAGRLHRAATRSGHPIYSFAVIGKCAAEFDVNNESGYGPDSPFAILRTLDGKIAILDLPDQHSMTFYHHVEEMHQVDYRYFKSFTGNYTDRDGITSERTYRLYVRDLERGVRTDVNPMGELLWEQGLYHGERQHQGVGMRTIRARQLYDAVSEVITSGKAEGLLFSIRKD
ncbi:MAG: AAC(3) family N-acetyltransferase [Polyangiaceae bacterium]